MSTNKLKKDKRLPMTIQYSIIVSWFMVGVIVNLVLAGIASIYDGDMQAIYTGIAVIGVPIIAFVLGFGIKWWWGKNHGTEEQQHRIRAEFWGALGFYISLVIALLAILLVLIMMEQDGLLPQSLPDPVTFTISMVILVVGVVVGYSARRRILRNFATA